MPRIETEDEPKLIETLTDEMKEVVRLARALRRKREERSGVLTTSKKQVDAAEQKLISAMHEAKMSAGGYLLEGLRIELFEQGEKVQVKLAGPGDDDDND